MTRPAAPFELLADGSAERRTCERALHAAGVRLALPHRSGWTSARRGIESLGVALRSPGGDCAATFGLETTMSRALPGYRVCRVERFGETLSRDMWTSAVDALATIARQPRVLRLTVELFSRDAATRSGIGELLADAGFHREGTARNWDRTLALDLHPDEEALVASFSRTIRQGLRAVAKFPVAVRCIDDVGLSDRLEALSRDAFARTGARYQSLWDWAGVIEQARRFPDATRLVGLFATDVAGPEALLGFAWAWWNGHSVSYRAGATSRSSKLRIQVAAPLIWDLIRWAKHAGATWFDLGGVSTGSAASGDPVGGISDFKRYFSKEVVDVAEDWTLAAHRGPARVAGLVSRGAAWLSHVARL